MGLSRLYYCENDSLADDVTNAIGILKSFFYALVAFPLQLKTGTRGTSGAPPIGAKWSMYYSCDGVTAGAANDGVDRVTNAGAYDASKEIRAAEGNAHSWAVLKSSESICAALPSTPFYLNITLGTGADSQITIYLSKAAPTGGSTTATPTAVDQVVLSQLSISDVTVGGAIHRFKYVTDAVGNFRLAMYRASTGLVHTVVGVSEFVAPGLQSSDVFPMCLYGDSQASGRGALNASEFVSSNGFTGSKGITTRSPLNTLGPSSFSSSGMIIPANSSFFTYTAKHQGNSKEDVLAVTGWFINTVAPTIAIKGTIPDFYMGNSAEAVGTVEPTNPAPSEHENVGYLWVPNGGTAMTL